MVLSEHMRTRFVKLLNIAYGFVILKDLYDEITRPNYMKIYFVLFHAIPASAALSFSDIPWNGPVGMYLYTHIRVLMCMDIFYVQLLDVFRVLNHEDDHKY